MAVLSPKRGAIPTPRHVLATAQPHVVTVAAPPTFLIKPATLSFWGNDRYGDCVTAEEAFAKACYSPEIFISDADAIAWATRHDVLNGAQLPQVMGYMRDDGFAEGAVVDDDGPFFAVDWTNPAALQSAISTGPVKIGIAADQIETAWRSTGGKSGWFATGFKTDHAEDHCTSLCGYGPIAWLAQQLGVQVPAGVDGTKPGYAMFTWSSIGIIDVPSMVAITDEAWVRLPTTTIVPAPSPYYFLQVKHSGQYLNILNAAQNNGAEACQGKYNTTDNFRWQILSVGGGYFVLRVKSSGQFLNILNASQNNGAMACQGVNDSTPNFFWQFTTQAGVPLAGIPAPGTEFYLRVKSSGQYLNILNAAENNGAEACQGVNNTTPNFVWKLVAA